MIHASSRLTDHLLNSLYPASIQALAKHHWTPLPVAREATRFLTETGNRVILDIGSGVGKFCLAGASYSPGSYYFGVEQRKALVDHAENAKRQLGVNNAIFLHANFTQLDLGRFEHFYFYNAFYENLAGTDKIDDDIDYSRELYLYYSRYLLKELQHTPAGTRLCTLCSSEDEVPPEFVQVGARFNEHLKFWVKP
jgi:hypothetical protein